MSQPSAAAATTTATPSAAAALPCLAALGRIQAEFAALDACHQQVLDTLAALGQLVEDLAERGVNDAVKAAAQQIVSFFDTTAHEHHAEEDRLVFPPLLEGSDAALADKVRRLQQDHGWLEQDWVELRLQMDAIAKGYSWYDIDALRAGVGVFTALYLDHIDLEESLIYPSAKRSLSERINAGAARVAAEQRHLQA
jgi:hemerythrin-like domain-containing protein